MTSSKQDLLVVTGATGWVGRTALRELSRLFPAEQLVERVRIFASRSGTMKVEGGEKTGSIILPIFPLHELPELARSRKIAGILHTAFLTRDRMESLGKETYVTTNRWITQQVAQALSNAPAARAVVISSGAAAKYDSTLFLTDELLQQDPYGVLKREEEILLSAVAPTQILRIYALSGQFIRDPGLFALGDFLIKALRSEAIQIQASMPVLRSYGHAGDITGLAWRWLHSNDEPSAAGAPLAAVSLTLDLQTLAERITNLYNLPPVQAAIDPNAAPHRYVAYPEPFLSTLKRYGLPPTSLEDQLRDTATGLRRHLNDGNSRQEK